MNPARKISRIMGRLPGETNQRAEVVWAKLFLGRAFEDAIDDAHYIARRLNSLNAHADALNRTLREHSVPSELFESQLQRFRKAILPTRMKDPWSNIRKELSDDIPLMFLWAGHTLGGPNYDDLSADIQDLIEKLDEVEALLEKGLLPESLADLFRKHLSMMRSAATTINSEGSEPFQRSIESLHFELSTSEKAKETIAAATPEQKEVLEKVKEALQRGGRLLGKMLGKAGTANQALQFADRVGLIFDSTPPV